MQTNTNGTLIAKALKEKITSKLDNERLSSRELEVLVGEIGEVVVSLQTLYFSEIHKLERKVDTMIRELNESVGEYLEDISKQNQKSVNVNLNQHINPEELAEAVKKALFNGLLKL